MTPSDMPSDLSYAHDLGAALNSPLNTDLKAARKIIQEIQNEAYEKCALVLDEFSGSSGIGKVLYEDVGKAIRKLKTEGGR